MDAETNKKVFCCLLPSVIIISLIVLVHSVKVGLPSHVLMVWPCNIIMCKHYCLMCYIQQCHCSQPTLQLFHALQTFEGKPFSNSKDLSVNSGQLFLE